MNFKGDLILDFFFILVQKMCHVTSNSEFTRHKYMYLIGFETTKGQLISKCLFEKIVWTKIPTKNLIDSAQQV